MVAIEDAISASPSGAVIYERGHGRGGCSTRYSLLPTSHPAPSPARAAETSEEVSDGGVKVTDGGLELRATPRLNSVHSQSFALDSTEFNRL